MSAIIAKEKQHYRRALLLETLILLVISCVVMLLGGLNVGLSFISGCMAAFLPQCLFVYWIFFRNVSQNANKMGAFYGGEGLKWLVTILLVVLAFKGLPVLLPLFFFAGYFLALLSNVTVPMYVKHRAK